MSSLRIAISVERRTISCDPNHDDTRSSWLPPIARRLDRPPCARAQRIDRRAGSDWLQWGGPARNFMADAKGLASTWPAGGPKKLWCRALGEGTLSWSRRRWSARAHAGDRQRVAAVNLGGYLR